jgi:hypothetical protein
MSRWMIAIVVTAGLAGRAAADQADVLFQKGKQLLADKKYAEACKAFQDVDRIDPGIGAKLNVARCFEEWGRLATAFRWYGNAEKMAADTRDDRAPKIRELMRALDARTPRITIRVAPGSDTAALTKLSIDGALVAITELGNEIRIDSGPHTIEYVVRNDARVKPVTVDKRRAEVVLELPAATATDTGPPVAQPARDDDPGRTRKIIGISTGAAGLIMMSAAGIITLGARGKYNDALEAHCMGSTSGCDAEGLEKTHDARSTANAMTVVTIIGAAAVAGGVVLYLTAPKPSGAAEHAVYVTPIVGSDSAGIAFGGRY